MALPCERCVSGPTTVAWTTSRGVAPLPRNAVLPAATLSAARFSLLGRCVPCRDSKSTSMGGEFYFSCISADRTKSSFGSPLLVISIV
jgi:hypothetical protein